MEKTNQIKVKQYEEKCQKCNRIIKAYSESQLKYNMNLHLEAHKRDL